MFKPTHSGCISKCVPPNKVDHYASMGWLLFCPNSGGWEFPSPDLSRFSREEDMAISSAPCLKVTVQRPDNSFVPNVQVTIQSGAGTLITVNTDANGVAQFDSIDPDQYSVKLNVSTFQPVDVEKDVDTGVNARLVVKLVGI
ncbi:MAG TPA: carboxypeptidase-like regulatory domain-containing protein [Chitinophagales bacterium]|nr:carboxypeptidase-like regulatory domain-containing protein [Chitinophagales bacterium]